MPATAVLRASALALLVGASSMALAQATKEAPSSSTYTPMVGQEGKDVVWVPTPQALVDKMLDMAHVTPQDIVMDLGSGDGRTVITAAKRGAHATGIEYNPDMVALSKANAKKAGVTERARFMKADLFQTDLSKATVITMFLLPDINLKLRPKLLALKPGTRVVSNTFTMGDWQPDATGSPENCDSSWCTALLWIIPAHVAGSYKTPQGEVTLKQSYQMLSGTLRAEGRTVPLEGRVRGEEVSFRAGGKEYRGRLNGHSLELN
ncbi:MAG TPA: class I SAM-dependent methyltransferase [Burkholderiales bacterium]|nr:class I SAM-dependent methyltransferase [Burkholderiales bacterium]